MYHTTADLLNKAIKKSKLSKRQIAKKAGIPATTLWRAQSGLRDLTCMEIQKLCHVMKIQPAYFYEPLTVKTDINDNDELRISLPMNNYTFNMFFDIIKSVHNSIQAVDISGRITLNNFSKEELTRLYLKGLLIHTTDLDEQSINEMIKNFNQ